MKLASRIVYILLLITAAFTFTLDKDRSHRSVVLSVLIGLACIYFILRLIAARRKARAAGKVASSGIHKISDAILIAATFGTMLALALIVWHIRYLGQPLLNYSLIICILGFCLKLFAPPIQNNTAITPAQKRMQAISSAVIYLCIICTITGLLLRINHFRAGKQLIYWGGGGLIAFLVLLIIYASYLKKRVSIKNI